MKKLKYYLWIFMAALFLGSCNPIAKVYTAGIGYGIFTTLAFLIVVVFIIMKLKKR